MNDGALNTTHIYAWLGRDLDGCEGILAYPVRGTPMPLIATDREVMESFRDLAQTCAKARNQTARLVVFERRELLEEQQP